MPDPSLPLTTLIKSPTHPSIRSSIHSHPHIQPIHNSINPKQGRVHLDDPVSLYLPEFATVRVYSPTANKGKGGE